MRFIFAVVVPLLGAACVVRDPVQIKTQVVTHPEGAIVEFNGQRVGRAPAAVVLPQDTNGKLLERSVIRAVPNTAQPTLIAQNRIFEPGTRTDRVPDRIMIDLTLPDPDGTNQVDAIARGTVTPHVETSTNFTKPKPRHIDRGKPTQPVGMDRWNPGFY